jgi:ankyrin repeat protein
MVKKVECLLLKDKRYLFEYDYFHQTGYHWAAKRGYNQILSTLFDYGIHINILDKKNRTPIWLAAKYNNSYICDLLIQNKANPFITDITGKKPYDVTMDSSIKKMIGDYMDVKNSLIYFNFYFTFLIYIFFRKMLI